MGIRTGPVRELRLELEEADEFFVPRPPHLASGTPALPPGIDQIRDALDSHPRRTSLDAVIVLPRAKMQPGLERDIAMAVGRYCEAGLRRADTELRLLRREGIRGLVVGIVVFAVFVSLSNFVIQSHLPEDVKTFFGEGLFLVVAWVGLWFPIDTLLYSGRPYRREQRTLRSMRATRIEVRAAD